MGFSVTLPDTPSGNAEVVNFTIMGYEVASISAGPFFKMNPSISLMVNFDRHKIQKQQRAFIRSGIS